MDKLLELGLLLHDIEVDRLVELESCQKDILQDSILAKANKALKLVESLKEPKVQEHKQNHKIALDEVKAFAEWQTDIQAVFGVSLISFDCGGIAITNPWVDCTGRFELSNKEAIRDYGVENYTKFIKEAIKALKFAKENGYKL